MSTDNPQSDPVDAAAAELRRDMAGLSDEQVAEAKSFLGSIGDKWWLLLVLGVISLLAGIIIVLNPQAAILTIAIFFGAWLLISGIFELIRGFGDRLDTGAKVLSIITGALSIILGILCFRNLATSVEILVLFIGIGLIMRGILELAVALGSKGAEGRGALVFIGILTLLAGVAVLVWPGIGLATLVYVLGFFLILLGVLEIVASFRVKAVGDRIDQVLAKV